MKVIMYASKCTVSQNEGHSYIVKRLHLVFYGNPTVWVPRPGLPTELSQAYGGGGANVVCKALFRGRRERYREKETDRQRDAEIDTEGVRGTVINR